MFAPKRPTNLSDPYTPEEPGIDELPEEMPIDDGPLHDWEIPDGVEEIN